MDGPVYRDRTWWQYSDGTKQWQKWGATENSTEKQWLEWDKQEKKWVATSIPSPPPSKWRRWQVVGSEPFLVYLLGILAAIAALGITLALVNDKTLVAAILAPVIGVIGTFTGHAAGHSAAVSVMREKS